MPSSTPATQDYQRAQVALRALTYKDVPRLWALLDPERLDETFTVFAAATLQLVRQRREVSVSLARRYLAALRAGVTEPAPQVDPPQLVAGEVLSDLRFASVIAIKTAMTKGRPLELASRNALVRTMGVADKFINDGGRELIRASVEADPAARGWVRVTLGTCDFCKEQAAGDHLRPGTADFPRHDHCGCVPEPVYDGGLQPEREFVDKIKRNIQDGTWSEAQIRALLDDPKIGDLAKLNARTALDELAAEAAELAAREAAAAAAKAAEDAARREALAAKIDKDAFLSAGQYDALTPQARWTAERREEILSALRETDEGRVLADTLERFQDGGSIARLRTNIEKYLSGVEIDATSRKRVEALLNAIKHAPDDWAPDTLYRGMTVKGKLENVLAKYVEGDSIDLSLTSFSSDRKIATKFQSMTAKGSGNETRVMVELVGDGKKVIPIQNLPRDQRLFKEKEWVSAGRYEIVSAKKSAGSILLRIRQVGTL